MWELGTRKPRKDKIDEMREYYDVTYEYLMGESQFKNERDKHMAIFYERSKQMSMAQAQATGDPSSIREQQVLMKFSALTEEHQNFVTDLIDTYYEKDREK